VQGQEELQISFIAVGRGGYVGRRQTNCWNAALTGSFTTGVRIAEKQVNGFLGIAFGRNQESLCGL